MAITGAELLSDLGELLLDPDGDIWDSDFKVARINEGLNLIASLRPDTTAVTEALVLAQTAKQDLPTGGTRLLDVPMNTDGLPVRKINRESMNESVPSWSTTTGSAIEHFMFDEETPKVFWVYPVPATAAVSVQISYSKLPTVFTALSSSVGIDDIFIPAVIDFVLSRCYGMETKGVDFGKAATHLNNFYTALGVKAQSDAILKQVQES